MARPLRGAASGSEGALKLVPETETPPAALELRGATRVHETAAGPVVAMGPVTMTLRRGELAAVMGPSGSGKSTLLSLAGALDQPTEGQVLVGGIDLASLRPAVLADLRRRTVGSVFQDFNLLPGLNARENVSLPLELDRVPLHEARAAAEAALGRVGLGDLAHRFPDDLSGGERQRIAIARAFVGTKSLLLADEPTGALDSVTGERIMRLLRELCDAGLSAIVATHNASHAAWCDRVLYLKDGQLAGSPDSVSAAGGA